MKIALMNVENRRAEGAMNKDLAGGMGTFSYFGNSALSKLISFAKKKAVRIPVLSFAYLQAIFLQQGHEVDYLEMGNPSRIKKNYDLVLIYGSIVDYKYENKICKKIKEKCAGARVGFFGSFPTVRPDLFKSDFVIVGEVESYFIYEFKDVKKLSGLVEVKRAVELNDLPTPNFDGFPVSKYSYFPAIREKPFLTIQASRGCPFSCSYYCAYGMVQGPKYRKRDASKTVEDIEELIRKYKIKGLQFRDPTFGLDKEQMIEFARLMKLKNVKIKFGIETRLDCLDRKVLKILFDVGLRNLNVGIETIHGDVAKENKRKLVEIRHQEELVEYCDKLGVKISAFYIFGLLNDTEANIKKTVDYAVKLNTNVAQFCISCPYPGTKFYEELASKNLITEKNFEKFNSMNLVFRHDNLASERLLALKEYAFRKYYFRLGYLANFIKWRIKEFLS